MPGSGSVAAHRGEEHTGTKGECASPKKQKKNVLLYLWIGCSWNSQTAQVCDIAEADCS